MKNTLMILVVGALLGTMLVGCGTAAEGNNTPETTPVSKPEGTTTPEANAPAANTPAANTPAPDANAAPTK